MMSECGKRMYWELMMAQQQNKTKEITCIFHDLHSTRKPIVLSWSNFPLILSEHILVAKYLK